MRRHTTRTPARRWPWIAALTVSLFLYAAVTAPTTTAAAL